MAEVAAAWQTVLFVQHQAILKTNRAPDTNVDLE